MHSEAGLEQINALLAALGQRMALPALQLDPLRRCQLVVDHRWHVTLLAGQVPDRLWLSCVVGPAGLAQRLDRETLLALLQAGFLGAVARGGRLAIDPEGRPCVQMELTLPGASPADLESCLLDLLACARIWQRRIEDGPAKSAAVPSSASGAWLHRRI